MNLPKKRFPKLLPDATIKIHSWSWVAASVVLIVLQLLFPDRAWTALLIIIGGTWLAAFVWTFSLGRKLSIMREMRYGWAQVGDLLQERYTLYNDSLLPALWVEIQDRSTIPDYQSGRVMSINGREIMSWQTEGICTRRGLFTLGPTRLRTGDPFGLCSVEIIQPDSTALLILPPVLNLPKIEIAAGGFTGEGRLQQRKTLNETVSVETIREYAPGDPLRAVHWLTSARRNALFVRQFDQMPSADWWIFLDLQESVQAGSGSRSTLEHGIILAASLADRGIHQNRKVGLVMYGETPTWLPPRSSREQLMNMMRALAVAHPGEYPLTDLLRQARRSIRLGASLIVITPNASTPWLAALFELSETGITPSVLLLDPASFGSSGSTEQVEKILADRGISHASIPPEIFDSPEARPGKQGRWEYEVVAPGKVVPVNRPAKSDWRQLS